MKKDRWELEKKFRFEAAHRLPDHAGKCARPHGHSYVLTVCLSGFSIIREGSSSGMIIDFDDISRVVKPIVETWLDHRDLNDTTGLTCPTAENICAWIVERIRPEFAKRNKLLVLEWVRLEETDSCSVKFFPGETFGQ